MESPPRLQSYRVAAGLLTPHTHTHTTGYFAWRAGTLEITLPSSWQPGGRRGQNSISVTSHGSKRPIRRCQALEKCKATVHFTSDSVSVSLAGSPVNSQPAVKVEHCRRQTAPPPRRPPLPVLVTDTPIDPSLLCIPIKWTEAACGIGSSPTPSPGIRPLRPTSLTSPFLLPPHSPPISSALG